MSAEILVVDRRSSARDAIVSMLLIAGYRVIGVATAHDAVHALCKTRFDIMLLSPNQDNIDACWLAIEAKVRVPNMIVMAISDRSHFEPLRPYVHRFVRIPSLMPSLLAAVERLALAASRSFHARHVFVSAMPGDVVDLRQSTRAPYR